ncbi:hypothetical protein [Clostridium sp. FS41]|uniref:hypothetical protein n=1 Tax=Clostridium sp. FS41 TaxID=1609975 RepID=UPI0005D3F03A|nr:hypothetical protein [Clostridium sp. FS41]KJJ65474.1 hypothetical protein CLFS41_57400 [Clostridium sp. FS41]
MENKTGSRINGGNTAYKRMESDYYPTPPEVTQALLDFLNLPIDTVIWEPACGKGHMVDVMEENGYKVIGTDIITGTDYLSAEYRKCDWIITNPPFSQSQEFIERSIGYGVSFAFLLKSQYWHVKKRYDLFWGYRPQFVLPLTWRPDFLFGKRGSGSPLMDVMWVVWGKANAESTVYVPLKKPVASSFEE